MNRPMIVAHRGASSLAAENTLAAYGKAVEIGADMIEFDVRITRDGIMIAYHDPAIAGRPIGELTFREVNELVRDRGFAVPAVAEVLQLTQGRIRLDVELKESGYEKELMDLILQYFPYEEFVITSFQDRALLAVKQDYPRTRTGLLLGDGEPRRPWLLSLPELFPLERLARIEADLIVAHYELLRLGFADRMLRAGKSVYVWTVDEPSLLAKLLHDGRIAAVITNHPDQALTLL